MVLKPQFLERDIPSKCGSAVVLQVLSNDMETFDDFTSGGSRSQKLVRPTSRTKYEHLKSASA